MMPWILATESVLPGARYFTADEVISPYIYIFCTAYFVSLLATPIVYRIALHYGVIDRPDGIRKMHLVPVAYLGGVAVFLGWLAGLAASQFTTVHHCAENMPTHLVVNFGIVGGACTILLVGLWDDILRISPSKKLLGQVGAAICLLVGGVGRKAAWGIIQEILLFTTRAWQWPFNDTELIPPLYDHWAVVAASSLLVIGIVVVFCNATNLMDGLDGLCGGVTAIVSAGYLFLAIHVAMTSGGMNINQDALRVVLGLALLGGVLGFVPFNFNPASIFMGDTGSMFLGFACATTMVLLADERYFKWLLAGLVIFSLPLLDTVLAIVRRFVNRRAVFSADRHHFHHQLVDRGFSVKQTVMISYGLSIAFCLLGVAIVYVRTRYAIAIYMVLFGSIFVAALKMGMIHERTRRLHNSAERTRDQQKSQELVTRP